LEQMGTFTVPAVARENRHSWLVHASISARPYDGLPAIAGERE